MPTPSKMDTEARVKGLYYVMQSIENKLGGGEGIEGLYGSLTRTGMQKVLHSLAKTCGLNQTSRLLDVGAGLGRPLLHALISPGVASGYGIEIDQIKCSKAHAFMRQCAAGLHQKGIVGKDLVVPVVKCSAIEKVSTLDPATHAYSFWEGVPVDAKCAFGRLFAASKSLQGVAVVQRAMRGADPAEVMADLGFGELHLQASFAVSMSGSGRSFTAYVFSKASFAQQAQRDPLSDVTVAQPVSPQPLVAQRAVAESPSPVSSGDIMAAVDESCTDSRKAHAGTAVISVHAHCTIAMHMPTDKQRASTVLPHGAQKTPVAKSGGTPLSAARCRRVSNSSKQNASAQSGAAGAVAISSVRRSQRQLQQRQVREQQEQDKIQHNVNINARVSDTITLLASPAAPAECIRRETVSEAGKDADLVPVPDVGDEDLSCNVSACQQLPRQQQRSGKASKPVPGTAGKGSKGLVHSPKGVKKQTSPVSKGLPRGSSLGARFPLRVRKNLEQSQGKQYLQDQQEHWPRNRGLADTARPVVS